MSLSIEQKIINQAEWKINPYKFVTECLSTVDTSRGGIRPFPDKYYLKRAFEILEQERLIVIPKSRQVFMTWGICAYVFSKILFHPYIDCYWQSQKRDDANYVLQQRMFSYYRSLPKHYPWPDLKKNSQGWPIEYDFELIHNKKENISSHCYAIAAGADQLRGKTGKIVVLDEFAFQDNQAETLAAVKPTIDSGGQLIIISSIKPGTVYQMLVEDLM